MKISFTKLVTTKPQVEVKADTYKSVFYDVNTAKTSGITINPKVFTDLDTIQIGGSKAKPTFTTEQKTAFLELIANGSYPTVSLANLYTYLSEKESNTKDTPYKIGLTDVPNEITGVNSTSSAVEGTIQYALVKGSNSNKYVDIVLPNNVTSIGYYAFFCCSSLTSVTISNSVTSIGPGAFTRCHSLTSVTIPNSVTSIGDAAFYGCSSLTSITIPNSVTSIGNSTFYGCSSLTSITIPNSVTSIGNAAFQDCSKLTTINYTGTEKQWNAITKGISWNLAVPSTCVINYNYQG